MYIRELNAEEYENFAKNHKYANYHQTLNYAMLKSEHDYEYEIIGFCDDDTIYAAALVLVKLIDGYLYAYVPEGFLIDYENESLVRLFTDELIKYYKKEDINFIKINPSIIISEIDPKTHIKTYTDNYPIINTLERCGYIKLNDNTNFESILPRVNAIVNLNEFNINNLSKNTKNKIRKGIRKGLTFEVAENSQMNYLNEFTKRKIKRSEFYYSDYYNIFSRNHSIDYFLVSVDYEKYILNSQMAYEKELKKNERLIFSDYETNGGKKEYSRVGGCYYTAKMVVLDYLSKIKKQSGLVILREAYENYIPLGVFNVRENIKEAMNRPYLEFETLEDCLKYAGTKLRIPIKEFVNQGTLLNEMLHSKQTTLDMYFKK